MNKQAETSIISEPTQQKNVIQTAKDFVSGVLSPLKGKDMGQMVEEFTSEMTLVAEGLSEDQHKLSQETERLSTMQTELEQRMLDGFHDAGVTHDETRSEIKDLRSRLERIEKQLDKKELKTKKSDGITGMLRQATWLVAIASGAWIVVTIINALT